GPARRSSVDQTAKMYEGGAKAITSHKSSRTKSATDAEPVQPPDGPNNSREQINRAGKMTKPTFVVEQARLDNRSFDEVKKNLEARVERQELEVYVVLPPNLLKDGQPEFRARNTADVFTKENIQSAVSRAVRGQRLVEAGIDEKVVAKASESVDLKTVEAGGKESKGEASF